jgi:hypothetical protein
MAPNWSWEGPKPRWERGRTAAGKGRECRNEREGAGSGEDGGRVMRVARQEGWRAGVQWLRKQQNKRSSPKGRTNNSDKNRSSLPNPGRVYDNLKFGNASQGLSRLIPCEYLIFWMILPVE